MVLNTINQLNQPISKLYITIDPQVMSGEYQPWVTDDDHDAQVSCQQPWVTDDDAQVSCQTFCTVHRDDVKS